MRGKTNRIIGVCFFILLLQGGCIKKDSRYPETFFIPHGYRGWIKIEYNISNTPPLPVINRSYIYQIPDSGLLKTSSSPQNGWGNDTYYYIKKDGVKEKIILDEMIWGDGFTFGQERKGIIPITRTFFVGDEKQFLSMTNHPSKIGPLDLASQK